MHTETRLFIYVCVRVTDEKKIEKFQVYQKYISSVFSVKKQLRYMFTYMSTYYKSVHSYIKFFKLFTYLSYRYSFHLIYSLPP